MKIAINGLGRIGRLILRAAIEKGDVNITALNSPSDLNTICHLINYDSVHGRAKIPVSYEQNYLIIGGEKIPVFQEKNPADLPWQQFDIDIVLECSGKFLTRELLFEHIRSGAKKVIVSAPCTDAEKTIIIGINQQILTADDKIISIGSCTTNALAPLIQVLDNSFGIEAGYITTVHAYTGDQNLVDNSHQDLRRARAAALSIIPAKTGAAAAISQIFPDLSGRLSASALRVPTVNVSLIDFSFTSTKIMTEDAINKAMLNSAEGSLKNILGIAESKLVSIDFNHTSYSSIFDPFETKVVNANFARILSWYDNEWAFALRMLDCCNLTKTFFEC